MDEGVIYGLYFAVILFNYFMKLKIERKGTRVERSTVREGVILGLSVYLLYQTFVLSGLSTRARVIDITLGFLSLAACAVFFVKGGARQHEAPEDDR